MPKICEMTGVRELNEGLPVELWRDDATGRLVLRAYNECGCNATDVDLGGLLSWLSVGHGKVLVLDHGRTAFTVGHDLPGDRSSN